MGFFRTIGLAFRTSSKSPLIISTSAVVAKTLYVAKNMHNISNLKGEKVVIYGAGPVARIAAILAAKEGLNTFLVETWDKSNEIFIKNLVKELNKEAGEEAAEIKGIFAPEKEERFEVAKDAFFIWSLAGAGVEILTSDLIKRLDGRKIVVDINLVPPYGIEGLRPKHDNEEISLGIYGIGALALGRLKANSEGEILKEAAITKGTKVFDYNYAFEVAKKLLSKN